MGLGLSQIKGGREKKTPCTSPRWPKIDIIWNSLGCRVLNGVPRGSPAAKTRGACGTTDFGLGTPFRTLPPWIFQILSHYTLKWIIYHLHHTLYILLSTLFTLKCTVCIVNKKVHLKTYCSGVTCVSGRHSRKYVTLLKLMTELIFFSKLLEHLFLDHFFWRTLNWPHT